jgi:cellulose synthase (UDP-forming)
MSGLLARIAPAVDRAAARTHVATVLLGLAVIPLGVYAVLDLPLQHHLALSLAMMGTGLAIARNRPSWRLAVGLLSMATSARYIWWRATETLYVELSADGATSMALFGAEIFGFVLLFAGYFQTAFTRPRAPVPLPTDGTPLPWVDIFVPSYNEEIDVVRRTLVGACAIDYPNKKVWLLDEKRRPHMKALCEELGCCYMTRPDNRGAKAGNINHALAHTDGELVAVFDADQVPVRSFLKMTVGYFLADPKMALVQTPHHFYNPDPFERNLYLEETVPAEQVMFYHVIQVGNDFWNSSFFCGSCAVLRRSALAEVGGIAQETVTEDAHTALKMHARGWRSAYLDIPQAAGLATERYSFYVTQRIRWARGMVQILRLDNPLFKRGLTVAQRINYFNAVCHFLFGVPRVVYLLAPPLYLLFNLHPLDASAATIAAYALPHVFLSVVGGSTIAQTARHSFWAEVFETAIAPYIAIITVLTLIAPRKAKFAVTAKGTQLDELSFDWQHAAPNLVLAALVIAAAVATPIRFVLHPLDRGTLALAGFWNLYNGMILLAATVVALDRSQRRAYCRIRNHTRLVVRPADPADSRVWHGRANDLSEEGVRLSLAAGPADEVLPTDVSVTLASHLGAAVHVNGTVLDARRDDGAWLARLRWVDPSPGVLRRIIEEMFSGSNTWIYTASPPDRPLGSAHEVLAAPWRALRQLGTRLAPTPEPAVPPVSERAS